MAKMYHINYDKNKNEIKKTANRILTGPTVPFSFSVTKKEI
jgi:hypothetical protein